MAFNPIAELSAAGVPVDALNEKQREVISDLSETEVATLTRLHRRIQEVGADDVEGHSVFGVGVF
jgi:hypothetical protein